MVKDTFNNLCKEKGISGQLSLPYCPEQKGLAERQNDIAKTVELCVRTHSGLPVRFLPFAIKHVLLIKNICHTTALDNGETLYQLWHEQPADLSLVKTFGCEVIVHIPETSVLSAGLKPQG